MKTMRSCEYRAYVVGEYQDGDENVVRFQATVDGLNYALETLPDYGRAIRKLRGTPAAGTDGLDLVLFCVGPELQPVREHLRELRAENRRVVVYAHARRASPHTAIEYCHEGLADDYFVWGEHVSGDRIEQHVKLIHQGKSPYPTIDVLRERPEEGKGRVFIASPYDPVSRTVMTDAVDHVLDKVNLIACWADDPFRDASIPAQVLREIERSVLVIANIEQGPSRRHNPNVYYEAGQATALGIPVIFVRSVRERDVLLPADIRDRQPIEYDNTIDLSMRLYRGLRS